MKKILFVAAAAAFLGLALYQNLPRSAASAEKAPGRPSAPDATAGPTAAVSRPAPAPAAPPASTLAEPATPAELWDHRVALLKQLLGELPAQNLPELRLLAPSDWIDVARRHELDTAADIRVALADLRALARKAIAGSLQEALRRFTAASAGELPADVAQLAPFLPAPADAAMLARYDLLRAGKLGDPAEKLLREKPTSDMILSVSLDGWSMNNNADLPPAFGETGADAVDRAWKALGTALGDEVKEAMAATVSPRVLGELMENTMKSVEPIYGDTEAFGDAMKGATRNFIANHPGETPADLAQILPYLKSSDKFVDALRPAFAQLDYLREHPGHAPAGPADLAPYLARPFDASDSFRLFKLQWDGEHLTLSYNWTNTRGNP